ncbi:MAG: EpsG family protein [Lachnospiraceae bacterium]|nr:EpsG family protein [Lachnospiraceae bacterium]
MHIYILFLFFLSFILIVNSTREGNNVAEQRGDIIEKRNEKVAIGGFIYLFLLFALRHPSMGNDLRYLEQNGYLGSFEKISSMSWKQIIVMKHFMNYEKGYILLNKIIGTIWDNQQFFLAVVAFISLYPIYRFIKSQSFSPYMSYIIFMGLPVFLMYYSGLRQIIAIGICCCSIEYIQKRQIYKFILLVALAISFHSSAWVFVMAYPVYHFRLTVKQRWISVGVLIVTYFLRRPIFSLFSQFLKKDSAIEETGAFSLFLVFMFIYIVGFYFENKDENEDIDKIEGFLNVFYISCFVQSLAGVNNLVLRVGYYFMVVLIVLLPNVVKTTLLDNNKKILVIGIVVGFASFGLYSLSTTFWAEAVPYHFFWNNL